MNFMFETPGFRQLLRILIKKALTVPLDEAGNVR